jgi:hypothetical protein
VDLKTFGCGSLTARKVCFPESYASIFNLLSFKKINMAVKGDYRENYLSPSLNFLTKLIY